MLKASDLTPGEKLLIFRRRSELTQALMAEELGVSLLAYRAMEQDHDYIPCNRKIPRVSLSGRLAVWEVAVILRFRSSLTQAQTAAQIGISKYWLRRMETNDAPLDLLLEYWELA